MATNQPKEPVKQGVDLEQFHEVVELFEGGTDDGLLPGIHAATERAGTVVVGTREAGDELHLELGDHFRLVRTGAGPVGCLRLSCPGSVTDRTGYRRADTDLAGARR